MNQGERFGRLVVISVAGAQVTCLCDCGTTKTVSASHLGKSTRSCGCLRRAVTVTLSRERITHGHTRRGHGRSETPEYRAWIGMKQRCYYEKSINFRDYGGRGITVCARWRDSFQAFLADVGPRPSSTHSIDRWPDNDGNYEPGNVRWATRSESNTNRRKFSAAGRARMSAAHRKEHPRADV